MRFGAALAKKMDDVSRWSDLTSQRRRSAKKMVESGAMRIELRAPGRPPRKVSGKDWKIILSEGELLLSCLFRGQRIVLEPSTQVYAIKVADEWRN